jgi:hypothetical protein
MVQDRRRFAMALWMRCEAEVLPSLLEALPRFEPRFV